MPSIRDKQHTLGDYATYYFTLFRQKPVFPIIFTLVMSVIVSTGINAFTDKEALTDFKSLQKLKKVADQQKTEEMNQMRNVEEFFGKSDFVVALHPLQRERLYTDVKKPNLDDLMVALEIKKEEKTV